MAVSCSRDRHEGRARSWSVLEKGVQRHRRGLRSVVAGAMEGDRWRCLRAGASSSRSGLLANARGGERLGERGDMGVAGVGGE